MGVKDIERFPRITCEDLDSFAGFTLRSRLPGILLSIVENNDLDRSTQTKMQQLIAEVQGGLIAPLTLHDESDGYWEMPLRRYVGKHWPAVPFYFAEAYLYRRIAEIFGWIGTGGIRPFDPFLSVKKKDILQNRAFFEEVAGANAGFDPQSLSEGALFALLNRMLWGNRSDLSQVQWSDDAYGAMKTEAGEQHLVVDHRTQIATLLRRPVQRIDIIADNAGVELFADVLFAHAMVCTGTADTVRIHVKPYPTFVSDATAQDVDFLLQTMNTWQSGAAVAKLSGEMQRQIRQGRLQITTHGFWNAPLHFYEMPESLYQDISGSGLVLVKGDANYRRLLGDRQVPHDADFRQLVDYWPVPGAAVRVLKSEIVAGMSPGELETLAGVDPEWMTNGRYGMVQCFGRTWRDRT
jgi:uncharacterized protein with ATP-grasp and redox domains